MPDIVISASPTFTRRKDYKAAGRKRSQDKKAQRKQCSGAAAMSAPLQPIPQSDLLECAEGREEVVEVECTQETAYITTNQVEEGETTVYYECEVSSDTESASQEAVPAQVGDMISVCNPG